MMKLLLILGLATVTLASAYAQGTIALNNSVGTAVQCFDQPGGNRVPLPSDLGLTVSVWWGTSSELTMAASGIAVGANGVIQGNNLANFQVVGTEAGSTVNLQIRASSATGSFRTETKVAQVTLGPTSGPGTVIWQGASSTNPNRFTPLIIYCPEPSTLALGGLACAILLLRARRFRKH